MSERKVSTIKKEIEKIFQNNKNNNLEFIKSSIDKILLAKEKQIWIILLIIENCYNEIMQNEKINTVIQDYKNKEYSNKIIAIMYYVMHNKNPTEEGLKKIIFSNNIELIFKENN